MIKGEKVDSALFIFNHFVEKITKESTRKGYGVALNFLMNCVGIDMGIDK